MKVLKGKSGIQILYHQTPSKLVSCRYFVKCGAIDEHEKTEEGLCHALEHMLFAGTPTRSWEDIIFGFRRLGAYSNASTAVGFTEYEILVPAENFSGAFEILSDLMYNPLLPEERWEGVEKGIIITEIQGTTDNPDLIAETKTLQHMLGSQYHPPAGRISNIVNAKVGDLAVFKKRYYSGSNIFLSVAGGIKETELLKVVNKYDRLPNTKPERRKTITFKNNLKRKKFRKQGLEQTIITMIKPCSDATTLAEKITQSMALDMLNNHLMSEVREKRGLCYHIGVEINKDIPGKSFFMVNSYSSDKETGREIIKEAKAAIDLFIKNGIDQDTLLQSKMENYRNFLGFESNPMFISDLMGENYVDGKQLVPIENYFKVMKNISAEEVEKASFNLTGGPCKITILEGD